MALVPSLECEPGAVCARETGPGPDAPLLVTAMLVRLTRPESVDDLPVTLSRGESHSMVEALEEGVAEEGAPVDGIDPGAILTVSKEKAALAELL